MQSLLYLLGRLATYCHAPEKVSAKLIVSHLKTVMGGVHYLDVGRQTIIDQLHNKAVMGGVQVQTRTAVKQIVPVEYDHIKLVLSNGEEILGKYAICTTNPNELNICYVIKPSSIAGNRLFHKKPHLLMVWFPPINPISPIHLLDQNQSHQLMWEGHF